MYHSRTRFASHKYLFIKNLLIDALPDFYVTREDLQSILEHFDHIERYRFEGDSEHGYWQMVYAKFKNSHYAEQAQKVLHSVRYISVEFLPDVLRRYDQLEEKIRFANQIYDHPSCVVVEPVHLKITFEDLLNKFSQYGRILSTSEHTDFVTLWYEMASEAVAAELDNNKWKNNTQYFNVKLQEQIKELTLRMINLKIVDCNFTNSYETQFEDEAYVSSPINEVNSTLPEVKVYPYSPPVEVNANLTMNKFNSEDILNSNTSTDFFDGTAFQSNNMQSNSNDIYEITPPMLYTCTETISNQPELVSVNPNDYKLFLQTMKKKKELNSTNINTTLNPSLSVETPEHDQSMCSNILAGNFGTLIPSCSNEIYEESESDAYSESSSSIHNNFQTFKPGSASTPKTPESLDTSNTFDLEELNPEFKIPFKTRLGGNNEIGSMPFYQYPIPANNSCVENSCLPEDESSVYNIPNSYNCPCCGMSIFMASPWSVVPNMFIVPITSFGKVRRSSLAQTNSPTIVDKKTPINNLYPTNTKLLAFDEENFPPLDRKNQVFTSNIKMHKELATINGKKLHPFNAINEQNITANSVNDLSAIKTAKPPKERGRKKLVSQQCFLPEKQTLRNQNQVYALNSTNCSPQVLSSTSSDERNDYKSYRRRHSRRKKHSQKTKDATAPVYSCSSNCTLNFKPANQRRHHPLRIEGSEKA